jgi:hypothetical protein
MLLDRVLTLWADVEIVIENNRLAIEHEVVEERIFFEGVEQQIDQMDQTHA